MGNGADTAIARSAAGQGTAPASGRADAVTGQGGRASRPAGPGADLQPAAGSRLAAEPDGTGSRPQETETTGRHPVANGARAPLRVLVTGAGGPAGIAILRSLGGLPEVRVLAADMDGWAAGLYLVPASDRALLPAGHSPAFVPAVLTLCRRLGADVVVPTVDAELRPLAQCREEFEREGIDLMLAPDQTLAVTLDKLALARRCAGAVRVPRTESLDVAADPDGWTYPVVVKPRSGSGSHGVSLPRTPAELAAIGPRPGYLVQEYLPGAEYSVDVLADRHGRVAAAVPRLRARIEAGVSVAGRTIRDEELEGFGAAAASAVGLTFIGNVQCRRDRSGQLALVEVNPRPPGALPLTIASGVDMPRLALQTLRGADLPEHTDFTETAMVRYLAERFVPMTEVEQVSA